MAIKTYHQCKDQIAIDKGFDSWEQMDKTMCHMDNLYHELNNPESWEYMQAEAAEMYADQFKPKWIDGYRETLKADLIYSVDLQEQGINEDLNRGREEGIKYALDMLDMHLSSAPERKEGL